MPYLPQIICSKRSVSTIFSIDMHTSNDYVNHINKQVRSSGLIVSIIGNGNYENNNNKRTTVQSGSYIISVD